MVHFWFGCALAQIGHFWPFTAVVPPCLEPSLSARTELVLPEKDSYLSQDAMHGNYSYFSLLGTSLKRLRPYTTLWSLNLYVCLLFGVDVCCMVKVGHSLAFL